MTANINRVLVTANLTKDPELRTTPGGTSICKLRIAVNGRVKRDGEWADKANYFTVNAWGKLAEACAEHLSKGSAVAVDGRLEWREWETDNGMRQAIEIVADSVQFLGTKGKREEREQDEIPF
jgi:single-strand DNA-binding protein